MNDEGPSSEDIERFSDETAICPDCGAVIYDDAAFCPACGAQVSGGTLSRSPLDTWLRERWFAVVAILVAVVILLYAGLKIGWP